MKHFTIEELLHSATAAKEGIDNTPSPEIIANLHRLVDTTLDPARERLGMPIYVNSGFRCQELNRKVGGAKNSYHLRGRAADLDTRKGRNTNFKLMRILESLPHTELIWEGNGTWIHVAL